MTWYAFRRQAAWNSAGQSVETGVGAVYAVTDTGFTTPLVARGIGGGAVMATVPITDFLSVEFEVEDHEEVYWKSGSMPPVHLMSAEGMRDDTRAARVAAEEARDAAEAAEAAAYGPADDTVRTLLDDAGSSTREGADALYSPLLVSGRIAVRENAQVIDCMSSAYGVVADGVTDDTSALQAALTACGARGGGTVLGPWGASKVSALSVPAGVRLSGRSRYSTTLVASAATGNVVTMAAASTLEDVQIVAGVTRTAGSHVFVTGNGGELRHVDISGHFVGVTVGTFGTYRVVRPRLLHVTLSSPIVAAGTGGVQMLDFAGAVIEGLIISGPDTGTQPDFGLRVRNGDTLHVSDSNVTKNGRALLVDPPSGQNTYALAVANSFFDSAGTVTGGTAASSAQILPAGGVYDTKVVNTWFGLSVGASGCYLGTSGSGVVDGVQFTGCEFVANGDSGLILVGTGVKNIQAIGGIAAGNGLYGIRAASATSRFQILGVNAGPASARGVNGRGITVDAGASDYYVIQGCIVQGNTTSQITDGGTGTHKSVGNNLTT